MISYSVSELIKKYSKRWKANICNHIKKQNLSNFNLKMAGNKEAFSPIIILLVKEFIAKIHIDPRK